MKVIPMEAEVIPMLIGGFSLITGLITICIFVLWKRNRDLSYLWFIGQVLFLSIGFHYVLEVLGQTAITDSMASEDVSLSIGLAAVFWALSMVCMIIGIWQISNNKRKLI